MLEIVPDRPRQAVGEGTVTSGLTGHNRRDGGNCLQIVPCKPAGQLICPRSS